MGEVGKLELCKACFETGETKPVEIRRGPRGEPWVESSIRRCANDECWNTTGGTLEERLTHIQNIYDYKYFSDYELTPEQVDAVWEAKALASQVPSMLEALRRIAAATPASTNSATIDQFRSWTAAVAAEAISLATQGEG